MALNARVQNHQENSQSDNSKNEEKVNEIN
jgi:hypothetical protein